MVFSSFARRLSVKVRLVYVLVVLLVFSLEHPTLVGCITVQLPLPRVGQLDIRSMTCYYRIMFLQWLNGTSQSGLDKIRQGDGDSEGVVVNTGNLLGTTRC